MSIPRWNEQYLEAIYASAGTGRVRSAESFMQDEIDELRAAIADIKKLPRYRPADDYAQDAGECWSIVEPAPDGAYVKFDALCVALGIDLPISKTETPK